MIKLILQISCFFTLTFSALHSDESLKSLQPYFLPSEMEIKGKLDALFKKSRHLLNSKTLKEAGFTDNKPRKYTQVIVTKHPEFEGFVFKIYLDAQRYKSDELEEVTFLNRIQGAAAIREYIEENGLQEMFKVPKKWLYPIVQGPKAKKEFAAKKYILVAEDMHLLDSKGNRDAWKSEKITKELLANLYQILKVVGLSDCAKIENIPFSEDGKVAFIDTESYGEKSVPFKRLKKSLNPKAQVIWDELIKNKN